jgi:hypothetical protein
MFYYPSSIEIDATSTNLQQKIAKDDYLLGCIRCSFAETEQYFRGISNCGQLKSHMKFADFQSDSILKDIFFDSSPTDSYSKCIFPLLPQNILKSKHMLCYYHQCFIVPNTVSKCSANKEYEIKK